MKTLMLRVCYWGLAVSAILIAPGANKQANADVPDPVADVLKPLQLPDVDADVDEDIPAPLAVGGASGTNAPVKPPVMVQEATPPPNLKLSPAMAEIVKLVQAGVSPDVLMAYVTNSTAIFNVDSDTIVYLNDLGVTNSVITALIQHDASPETAARRASANAVQPLPPGVSAAAPVSNVYPPAANRTFPVAGQTTYPGDFATVTDTNVATELPPAVEAPLVPAQENVSVNYFYSSLSPYGSWVDVDGYGLCWRPTVAVTDPYWRPYCNSGRWMWSDCGWYWYSDYSWGWAPFHYGRWCSYPRLGWVWVPGSVWSPSWVTWRYTDGYCGWAPLPPGCGYRSGIGLTWYGRGVSVGFDFGLGWGCYSYVPIGRFCDWHVSRHCLPDNRLHVVHASSVNVNKVVVRNRTIVNNGIEPNTIARASRTKIPTMHVKESGLAVNRGTKPERLETSGNSVTVVRPQLPKNPPAAPTLAARGNATHAKPVNLGNASQASALARPGSVTPPNSSVSTPRGAAANLAPPNSGVSTPRTANSAPANTGVVRDQGTARHENSVAIATPNSGVRTETATRAQPANPNVSRQSTPAPAPTTPTRQSGLVPATRNNDSPAPVARNTAPPARNLAPPQSQAPTARPNPAPQTAPAAAPRATSPMIRSFAEPQQRSIPNSGVAVAPQSRLQNPTTVQPSVRPQVVAPRAELSRPSAPPAAVQSAPSVSRSVPNSGGGGGSSGGGNRSSGGGGGSGGKNRGGD